MKLIKSCNQAIQSNWTGSAQHIIRQISMLFRVHLWLCLWSCMFWDGCTLAQLCPPPWPPALPAVGQLVFLLLGQHINEHRWKRTACFLGPVSWIPSGKRCLKWASTPALWGTTTSLLLPLLACTQCTIRLSTRWGLTTYLLRTPYFHLFLSRYTCLASLMLGRWFVSGNCLLSSLSLKDHSPDDMVIYAV